MEPYNALEMLVLPVIHGVGLTIAVLAFFQGVQALLKLVVKKLRPETLADDARATLSPSIRVQIHHVNRRFAQASRSRISEQAMPLR